MKEIGPNDPNQHNQSPGSELRLEAQQKEAGRPRDNHRDRIIKQICETIETDGVSDTTAALLAGVSQQDLAKWNKEDGQLVNRLGSARVRFQGMLVKRIRELALGKKGEPDWRADVWLLEEADEAVLGAEDAMEEDEEIAWPAQLLLDEEEIAWLRVRREAAMSAQSAR